MLDAIFDDIPSFFLALIVISIILFIIIKFIDKAEQVKSPTKLDEDLNKLNDTSGEIDKENNLLMKKNPKKIK